MGDVIRGMPTSDLVGVNQICIKAADQYGDSVETCFDIAVVVAESNPPYVNNSLHDQTVYALQEWEFDIPKDTFTDPDEGDVLTISEVQYNDNALPEWLAFD